jgi:hypothetical protein
MVFMILIDWVYLPLLLLNSFLSIFRWRLLSTADRLVAILLCLTAGTELIGREMAHKSINNLLVYRIYDMSALVLIALYFHQCLLARTRSFAKWIPVGFSVAFSLGSIFFLPTTVEGQATFLLTQATIIIALCLFSIRHILLKIETLPYRFTQFWLTSVFLLYWSLTFTGWGVSYFSVSKYDPLHIVFFRLLMASNFVLYSATALILFFYKKLIPSGE